MADYLAQRMQRRIRAALAGIAIAVFAALGIVEIAILAHFIMKYW